MLRDALIRESTTHDLFLALLKAASANLGSQGDTGRHALGHRPHTRRLCFQAATSGASPVLRSCLGGGGTGFLLKSTKIILCAFFWCFSFSGGRTFLSESTNQISTQDAFFSCWRVLGGRSFQKKAGCPVHSPLPRSPCPTPATPRPNRHRRGRCPVVPAATGCCRTLRWGLGR